MDLTPSCRSLWPKFVFKAAFVENRPQPLQDVAVLSLNDAVGCWTVVGGVLLFPLGLLGCMCEPAAVVSVEQRWLYRYSKAVGSHLNHRGAFRHARKGF